MMNTAHKSRSLGAARTPRAVPAPGVERVGTLVRIAIALVATATLLFLITPSVIRAQDRAGLHTVAAGESLWSVAAQFYGDGRKWTELAKLNDLGDQGVKQLVVGQVIKVPGTKLAPSAVAVTPPPNTPRNALMRALNPAAARPAPTAPTAPAAPPAVKTSPGALAAQTAGRGDAPPATASRPSTARPRAAVPAAARPAANPVPVVPQPTVVGADSGARDTFLPAATRVWSVDLATQRGARGTDAVTVFQGRTYDPKEVEVAVKALLPAPHSRARDGEYVSAPYAVAAASLAAAGSVGRHSGAASSGFQDMERFTLMDEVEVRLPAGSSNAAPGTRFVSVDTDVLLKPGVQVVVPTGLFEIVRADSGRAVIARVLYQSGRIQEGQRLVPLEGQAASAGALPVAVARSASGPEAEVVWVESGALLPSLQSFLLLNTGEAQGVKAGDEFALVKRMGLAADAQEQHVALVRVVRVTEFGSTAIVIHQDQARIAVGGPARLVARVE